MTWNSGDVYYSYIDYDGSEECQKDLLSKDLFVEKDPVRGDILKEACGLMSCKEIGELSEDSRIVIVFGKVLIIKRERKEVRVRVTVTDKAYLYQLNQTVEFLKNISGLDIWEYSKDEGICLVFDLCVPAEVSRKIGEYARNRGWIAVSYPPQ